MNTRRQRLLAATSALGGLLLFVYAVRAAGVDNILDGIHRVGWGLGPILVIAGIRYVLRSEAWRLCAPPGVRLPHRQALMAFVAGDAVGSVTPLGLAASEPTKMLLIRRHLATRESVTSLALDNLVYSASVIAVVAIGLSVLLTSVRLGNNQRLGAEWVIGGLIAVAAVGIVVVRRRLPAGSPSRLLGAFALDVLFHAAAVVEAYLTLRWLLAPASPTFVQALLFEVLNRVLTVVFKFVPFRVGIDEAASGALAPLLALNPVAGVSVAVIRKVRSLFWAAVGLALIGVHHAQAGPATDHPGTVPAHRT